MLYSYNETLKIILRIYEYLQMRMKEQPRTLKMNKPLHRSAVVSFMETLPPTAGADFIWNFLLFQFYVFVGQDHERKPMPSWFMGKEAWRRWSEYSMPLLTAIKRTLFRLNISIAFPTWR